MTNGDEVILERWDYAEGRQGAYVLKEMKKAKVSVDAVGRVELGMKRVEDNTALPQELDVVRDGVHELRVQADKRWYRLLWGRCGDRFVALTFIVKKRNKLDPNDIRTAIKRLKEHRETR